jgi:Ca2+-binding RTX toxin-like protein
VVGDGITNDNTLTLTGTAAANSTVRVYDGTTLLGSATANGSGAWSYTTGTLSNATHSFTATASDAAGNTSAVSAAMSVTVNAASPNLVVNGGFESGNFSGWTVSGNSGGIYVAPTDYPGEVHTGNYSAGLGGYVQSDGILRQNIATSAGQHYTLSYWILSDNDASTPINHFVARWNGQNLMAVTNAPNSGYQLYTFDVVGINGNSVLELAGYNIPDAWRLDDVSLSAVGTSGSPVGTGGNDTFVGGRGNDTLVGTGGNDTFNGGRGSDTITTGAGTNFVDGGSGIDVLDYSGAAGPVDVNLATGRAANGFGGTDSFRNIENVSGSAFGDTLIGSSDNNVIDGRGGADRLTGNGGNDTFVFIRGQANSDTVTDFRGNGAASGDQLMFVGYGAALDTFAEVLAAASQVGPDVVFNFGNEGLTLQNVRLVDLQQNDFKFA